MGDFSPRYRRAVISKFQLSESLSERPSKKAKSKVSHAMLRPSVGNVCIVAKRCDLEQKLLLSAYNKVVLSVIDLYQNELS